MGSYTFRWEGPASDVYVTGTFDDWAKSVQLDHKDGRFEKTVQLPENDDKVLYKFVVDGNWTTSTQAPQEDDGHGIYNNVLLPADIFSSPSAHIMSSAAPDSTTAQLAADEPKETPRAEDVPGAFIETPANELNAFSVSPIPASNGDANPVKLAPGEPVPDPSTLHSNTVDSTVQNDEELKAQDEQKEQAFGVNPLPATNTAGNPISLAPGEKVPEPESISANNVHSNVTLDKESYEKGASLPPQLGPVVTPEAERGAAMFDIPGITSTTIPESSLPIGSGPSATEADPGVTVQSAHPESTTATLAGQVPKEPRSVPDVVSESQADAGVAPEASANPIAVDEKAETEQELLEKVPEQPATSENSPAANVAGAVAGGVATAGTIALGAAVMAKDKASEAIGAATTSEPGPEEVPKVVTDSIEDAHASPEAAANPEAVADKAEMEDELLNKVAESNATGQTAEEKDVPATVFSSIEQSGQSPEAAANPEAVADKAEMEEELLKKVPESEANGTASTSAVPDVVKESIAQADASPEAATNPEAIEAKSAVESELKQEVQKTDEIADVAPTESAALSATAPAATTEAENDLSPKALSPDEPLKSSSEPSVPETSLTVPPGSDQKVNEIPGDLNASADKPARPEVSRDVSPTGDVAAPTTTEQTEPTVTTGTETTTAPATSEANAAPAGPTTTEQTEPTVTTGPETTTAPATSEATENDQKPPATPAKSEKDKTIPDTPASSGSDKKAKRRSFWGKLKDKFTGGAHKEQHQQQQQQSQPQQSQPQQPQQASS
ncbi:putative carbohydrate-binding module family 48 protein [Diplodia seriata]|uniref:Putative carbohydrate-binding module family 48 protein n=1 Tax=Diplodia seriata TaxID=420778 RepID=A0A0G2DW16_9PEZI|nr:putative carbohydrate-binding module family 48 protein [Diplodia seriata]